MRVSGLLGALVLMAGVLAGLVALPADARTLEVARPADLRAALQTARAGDVLRLAPGTYERVTFTGGFQGGGGPVTLTSADPDTPAVIARLVLSEVSGLVFEKLVIEELQADTVADLTFRNILFDYDAAPGADTRDKPFDIRNGADITIRDSLFDGDVAEGVSAAEDGVGTGFGLRVGRSTGVLIEDNEFATFHMGLQVSGSDIVIRGNDIHAMRCDGIRVNRADHVLIEDNHIHDFMRTLTVKPRDHSDMIQLWTQDARAPLTHITIRNNVLDMGRGDFTQSIFMRNEAVDKGVAGAEMFYRELRIEGNVILNGQLHGITAGETDGLVIRNNTLIRVPRKSAEAGTRGRADWIPQINVKAASVNVVIRDNITPGIDAVEADWAVEPRAAAAPPGWDVAGNLLIQDVAPGDPGFYDTVFVDGMGVPAPDLSGFRPRADGPAARPGLGAPRLAGAG